MADATVAIGVASDSALASTSSGARSAIFLTRSRVP